MTVEANQGAAQGFHQLDNLEITYPPRAALNPSDREAIDIPPLTLTTGRQFALRKPEFQTQSSNLSSYKVFTLGHLCVNEHRILVENRRFGCARTRNK